MFGCDLVTSHSTYIDVLKSLLSFPMFLEFKVMSTLFAAIGKVNLTNKTMRLKWGIGRIIAEVKSTPVVLPFWHSG